MMAELRTILQKIDEEAGVAWLTFNRPEKKNALSQRLMIELIEALKELSNNEKIK
jgi:enoyl-CoA hydratase/carnithine racemase